MECVDAWQQNNLFEDKISAENMMSLQHPERSTEVDESQDSVLSEEEEVVYRTTKNESKVKDMDEDSEDDIDQHLSSRRFKRIILSDDEDSEQRSASVTSPPLENEDSFGQRKIGVIGSDLENDDDDVLFNKTPSTEKPKVK